MPALWSPRGGGSGLSAPMSNADIGQGAMPIMQPTYTPVEQVARVAAPQLPSSQYATLTTPGRPYADVGKMAISLTDPGVMGQSATNAQGFFQGLGAGAGRLIGGIFGQGQAGADIGQAIGTIPQVPLNLAANALGNIPALPGLSIPGIGLLGMTDEEKKAAMQEAGGNPFALFHMLSGVNKADWQAKIASGEVNPMFASLGGADTLGDQIMNLLGMAQIPGHLIERAWAGGPGNAIKDVMSQPMDSLSPEVQAIRQQYADKKITDSQFLDQLTMSGAGYSRNWVLNLVAEMGLDPANLLMGAGTAIGFASKGAKIAEAASFVDALGGMESAGAKALARDASERIAQTTGEVINPDQITRLQLAEEAKASGGYGAELSAARNGLDAQTKIALHPGFAAMEPVADFASKVLNPLASIGGGPKPLENAYLSREGTKGVAQRFGLDNWNAVSSRLGALGKSDLFNHAMGYFTAQEGVLMAGESLAKDVASVRNVMDVRPTQIALARAKVGTTNYAQQMERWLSKRSADLARLSGGTKEEAMARAQTIAQDKLGRMGLSAEEAAGVTKGLDENGLNMIDAMYFGHRIETYNVAMRGAREAIAAKISTGVGVEAAHALQRTVDRLTLIGPRELTYERAQSLKAAIAEFESTGSEDALKTIRDSVRQYDRLAATHLADGTSGEVLAAGLKDWLKEYEGQLTHEIDPKALSQMPSEIVTDATRGDGYIYGLRPEDGAAEWRVAFDEAGNIKSANPWIDIVGDEAQPWNLRFQPDGPAMSFANAIERSMRFMGQQISSDRIDREARQSFIDRSMGGWVKAAQGKVGTGLTYEESRGLYNAVKTRALDASTSPRGLMVNEFNDVIRESQAAQRVGMTGADLQLLSLQAFEGNVGTVGLTQKLSGRIKTVGSNVPLLPANSLGVMAERIYPLIRFTANPFFQLQEWVEPWVFSWARGEPARMAKGWIDPITGTRVTLDHADLIQQHLIERYRAANPAEQFDMMERSLTYLLGQKAAKEAAAATDQATFTRALARIRSESTHGRKEAASSRMFRYFLGPNLKEQFDKINPNIWQNLEQEFGTRDKGQIAMRWLVEKDRWASADPAIAYHLMDATKEARYGARAAVDLESNAKVVFKMPREALNMKVKNGSLGYTEFRDAMTEVGAHPDYIDRTWKATQFEVKTGGVQQWWDDALPFAKGGAKEIAANRSIVQALAETAGISETELLSRTLARSPVSLLHDDLIGASEDDLAAWGTLLQQGQNMAANYYDVGADGASIVSRTFQPEAEQRFLATVAKTPDFIKEQPGMVGQTGDMQRVGFRDAAGNGRDVFIPGGLKALADRETPWTAWEAHVIRAQVLNPNDMLNNELKAALDEKMWRGHMFDMTDEANLHKVFNNYVFAMHSANMSLTRNELISSRFRAQSMNDVVHLAEKARAYRSIIEPATGMPAKEGELGLAYSTERELSHYVPLDNRLHYYGDHLLPERTTTIRDKGVLKQVHVPSTESVIEERAQVAKHYLEDTTKEQRTQHGRLDTLQDEYRATLKGQAKKDYKPPDRLENWGIDEIVGAVNKGGIEAIDSLPERLGFKRAAKFTPTERATVEGAVAKLSEDPLDLEARAALRPFVTTLRGHDANIIFKDWNVNGAGRPYERGITGEVTGHGDKELFAYLKNDDVAWRGTATNGNIGQSLMMAENFRDDPSFYVRRAGEPLDQYGERISHRTQGLRLKTGFFGTDLGNPLEFNRGIHDIHMVGDLTEWMYDRTKKGSTKQWSDWLGSLSADKQKLIGDWIDKGAPHGAGAFEWKEATGTEVKFSGTKEADRLIAGGSTSEKAAWVRDRINKWVDDGELQPDQRDRLFQMYRNDGELADLLGRDIHTFGGDYQVFENTMTERKAIASRTDPSLNRHGNGGYQWKLWDERRHVWDPETTAFDSAHGMDRRSIRYMAASDDIHNLAGFYNKLGQPGINALDKEGEQVGYSFLDPVHTVLTQKDGRVIRGATISLDTGEKIIGFTKYRNQTTFLHEMAHTVLEPLLDPSGRQVVLDDLNAKIDAANADVVAGGARYEAARTAVEDAANAVNDTTAAAAEAKAAHVAAKAAKADPEAIRGLKATLDESMRQMRAATKAHTDAVDAFNTIATSPLKPIKTGWDRETSEHLADEFGRWLATGKATNPKMKDAFSYFRQVLLKVKSWLDGQPGQKVSPEVQRLFEQLTTPPTQEASMMGHALPFDATQEMMHAGAIQSVVNAEDAAFQNVQFKRSRSWLERSINHPYFGIYPASYMWGKVAPEIVRGLAVNPFGLPIPILSKPVKIGAHEYGLHGSPFYGFVNAQRVWNSVQMQKTTDPSVDKAVNDKKNQQVWMNLNMLLPATPWDVPANFSLWMRRVAEYGLTAQDKAAQGQPAPAFDLAKTAGEVATYAFGYGQTAKTLSSASQTFNAPIFGGKSGAKTGGSYEITPEMLMQPPAPTLDQSLQGAQQQLQEALPK